MMLESGELQAAWAAVVVCMVASVFLLLRVLERTRTSPRSPLRIVDALTSPSFYGPASSYIVIVLGMVAGVLSFLSPRPLSACGIDHKATSFVFLIGSIGVLQSVSAWINADELRGESTTDT